MFLFTLFSFFLGSLVFLYTVVDRWLGKRAKRPPGPTNLPIFGCLIHFLPAVMDPSKKKGKSMLSSIHANYKPAYIIMDKLSKTYGPLTFLKFGINNAVILSTPELAKEVLCREEFAHRFADGWFVERSFGKALGLIFNNNEPYKDIKRFTVRTLKDFGFGKKQSMESAVEDELVDFIHDLNNKVEGGTVVRMEHMFTLPVLNILWQMVGGFRFSYDDKKLLNLISTVEELSRTFDIGGNILMAFPFLRFVAPELTGHAHQMRLYSKLHQFFRDILQERREEGSYLNPKDFIDIFLIEMDKQKKNEMNGEPNLYTEEQFIMVCLDLFTAGSETTANTLDFAMLYMLLNPRVQKKVQEEIDEIIGPSRFPNMKDQQLMPYTEATLLEVQRMCNVIPLVHRVTTENTTLGGYNMKKDDIMLINLHSIHMNSEVWDDPDNFRPERFIDSKGSLNSHHSFLPFGMGKRVCIGETLAKLTLFTYFTSVLQRFSINPTKEYGMPKPAPGKGFTLCPEPFHAFIKPRI